MIIIINKIARPYPVGGRGLSLTGPTFLLLISWLMEGDLPPKRDRSIQCEVTHLYNCWHDLEVMVLNLINKSLPGHLGYTLIFGQKLYSRSRIYHWGFPQIPEWHPEISEMMAFLLGHVGSDIDISVFIVWDSILLPVNIPIPFWIPGHATLIIKHISPPASLDRSLRTLHLMFNPTCPRFL